MVHKQSLASSNLRDEVREKWSLGEKKSGMKARCSRASSERQRTKAATHKPVLPRTLRERQKRQRKGLWVSQGINNFCQGKKAGFQVWF